MQFSTITGLVWHWAENVHTAVWILAGLGITATSTARFVLHMQNGTVVVGAVSVVLLLFGLFVKDYARRRVLLTLLDVKPDPARDRPDIIYKSKLRVVYRNDSVQILIVRAPEWDTNAGDVPPQRPTWSCLELEGERGYLSNQWQKEAKEIHVNPKEAFRASVALDPSVSDEDVRRRQVIKQLGNLVLPLNVAGHDVKFRMRF